MKKKSKGKPSGMSYADVLARLRAEEVSGRRIVYIEEVIR